MKRSLFAMLMVACVVASPAGSTHILQEADVRPSGVAAATVPAWTARTAPAPDRLFDLKRFAAKVPEPGSWVMMFGGFALLGSSLRGQRPARDDASADTE